MTHARQGHKGEQQQNPKRQRPAKTNGYARGLSPPATPSTLLQGLGWAERNPQRKYREVRLERRDDRNLASAEPGEG